MHIQIMTLGELLGTDSSSGNLIQKAQKAISNNSLLGEFGQKQIALLSEDHKAKILQLSQQRLRRGKTCHILILSEADAEGVFSFWATGNDKIQTGKALTINEDDLTIAIEIPPVF